MLFSVFQGVKKSVPSQVYAEMKLSNRLLEQLQMSKHECEDLEGQLQSAEESSERLERKMSAEEDRRHY